MTHSESLTCAATTSTTRDPDLASRTNKAGTPVGPMLGSIQGDATKRPNSTLIGYTSTNGHHSHSYSTHQAASGGGGDHYAWNAERSGQMYGRGTGGAGNHSHSVYINSGGDAETRPKNVYVNFMIKY